MGALGKLFSVIFGRFIGIFGVVLSTKLLLITAAIGTFLVMLVGLTAAFNAAISAVQVAMPSEFQWGLGIIPTNIPVCVSTIITARCTLWLFQVKWAIVKLKVNA